MNIASLIALLRNPNTQVAIAVGATGLIFVVANLWLASELPVREFAVFSLLIAIVNVSVHVGVGGFDGLVNRHHIKPDADLVGRVLITATSIAAIAIFVSVLFYDMNSTLLLLPMIVAILAGAVTMLVGAAFQARQDFGWSLMLLHGPNVLLLLCAAIVHFSNSDSALLPFLVIPVGYLVFAFAGWRKLVASHPGGDSIRKFGWREPLAYLAIIAVVEVLIQLERLIVPALLTMEDLATFSVLASVTGPPFRLMQMSFGFTLLPKLRAARTKEEYKRLIKNDFLAAVVAISLTAGVIWFIVPVVLDVVLQNKYSLSGALVIAVIIGGTIKVFDRIVRSVATATLPASRLERLGMQSIVSIIVSVIAAFAWTGYGLVGIVYAVNVGWFTNMCLGLVQIVLERRESRQSI